MTKEAKAGQASNLAERENEDGRKMVWQECAEREAKLEWGIKVKSKRGCREKQQRGFEELRQLNHEDRRASAEMFGKKVGGKNWKTHRAREESRRVSKAWKKLDITSSWGVITDWKVDTVRGKKAWQSSKRDRELSKRSQREAGVPASIWMSLLPWLMPEPPILLPRCLAWPLSRCSMLSRQL